MEKITIEINTTNSAFEGCQEMELARILRKLADSLESGLAPSRLMDINGNKTGQVEYK